MLRKLAFGTIAAIGLLTLTGVSADAGCHPRGYGPRYGRFYGGRAYPYGPAVVVAPQPVLPAPPYTAYPVYGYYPYNYGYGPGYRQAFGLQTGNFSLFLGR
jgi:hypothetical protein